MLLLHQVGSVKIGEVIRYTVTYTPSQDRILPSPEKLYVRIRNTSAIALRAAFVRGPYTLSVAAYPSNFTPNEKSPDPRRYGLPDFEPMLKAGGSWECELVVPDDIRQSAGLGGHGTTFGKDGTHDDECASWVIEIASQIIFSSSTTVSYEVVVGRDQKSLTLSQPAGSSADSQSMRPGKLVDHQQSMGAKDGHHPAQPQGIFSRAVKLKVQDTATLWNTPRLPGWDDQGEERARANKGADKPVESMVKTGDAETADDKPVRRQKKVHLVLLTHGLHSNLGADMLYMKESIDAAAKQAKIDATERRKKERAAARKTEQTDDEDEDEDEEVVVRGYSGNATKTEKGIKYLGKRLARYVLSITYPDQPFIPLGKSSGETLIKSFDNEDFLKQHMLKQAHKHSKVSDDTDLGKDPVRPYIISSISFVGHSLGGLVQTYAVAYIQKHSPQFFDLIRPINFIALATPFLGLSNENPMYVKFALDFGLVGRTGKDLGLTWRAPTIARNGWGALVGNLGESAHKSIYGESTPEKKPLLRILPTGPAHTALKKFRNRTTYSNVVNDGIVPLRTSCLLFLDWQGLGRVEKARRDVGLVETVVGFGWAELTGSSMSTPRSKQLLNVEGGQGSGAATPGEDALQVPQPDNSTIDEDDRASLRSAASPYSEGVPRQPVQGPAQSGPLSSFFNLFKSDEPPKPEVLSKKQKKMLRTAQTIQFDSPPRNPGSSTQDVSQKPGKATTGHEHENESATGVSVPPRTTFFESAGDLLNPKMPDNDFFIDPSLRPRTIFHDRVYHPSDIPPPPLRRHNTSSLMRKTFRSSSSSSKSVESSGSSTPYPTVHHQDSTASAKDYDDTVHAGPSSSRDPHESVDGSGMRVEEKIARGYHRGLAWRKVLVKLEPDAHNNIIVRRTFANAFGWPVMKHLADVHFSDSVTARTETRAERLGERALDASQPPDEHGRETRPLRDEEVEELRRARARVTPVVREDADAAAAADDEEESRDAVPSLLGRAGPDDGENNQQLLGAHLSSHGADASVTWSERDWADSEDGSDGEEYSNEGAAAAAEGDGDGDGKGGGGGGGARDGAQLLDPASWKWTEKIVGKGASSGRKSPAPGQKQA